MLYFENYYLLLRCNFLELTNLTKIKIFMRKLSYVIVLLVVAAIFSCSKENATKSTVVGGG